MSLTGSLFAGVSGLNSQGTVMGVIGDNIANISTVGFKSGNATFSSLVTGDSSGGGGGGSGAIAKSRLAIDQQGLIQATGISTDIAISGQGFFVVTDNPNAGEGQFLYTRSGSFRQDERGNFINAGGFVLQAWPLDSEGRLPGEIGNLNTTSSQLLESLTNVNTRDISGLAFATTTVSLGLNLDAGQAILAGAGDVAKPISSPNVQIGATSIIAIPSSTSPVQGGALQVGDILDVTLGGAATTFEFQYGGFVRGWNIATNNVFGAATATGTFQVEATAGDPDHLEVGDSFTITQSSLAGTPFTFQYGAVANAGAGIFNSLQTLADAINNVSSLTSRVVEGRIYVSAVDATESLAFADVGSSTIITNGNVFQYGNFAETEAISAGNTMFGAATSAAQFTAGGGGTTLTDGDTFTITHGGGTSPTTFTFIDPPGGIVAANGEYNSLATLAAAINANVDLNAKIEQNLAGDDRLVIWEESASGTPAAVTIASAGAQPMAAGDFQQFAAAGFIAGNSTVAVTPLNRFNTMDGLADLVTAQTGLTATIQSASVDSSISINLESPLETITFTNNAGNTGNMITEFGLSSTIFQAVYDAADGNGNRNMASGGIAPAFSRNIRIFDSLGTGHDIRISFVKSANNQWLVEMFAANPTEIVPLLPGDTDGLIASGSITFNGDGTLASVSPSLQPPAGIPVNWTNLAQPGAINLNLGTAGVVAGPGVTTQVGLTDGLSQFNGPFNVQFADQNGAGSGLLSSLEIDAEGFVIANFSNGQSRDVFKIPLASFPNVNGLSPNAGNVFSSSDSSGEFSLNQAGASGVGVISVAALEGANVELANELTKMIVAQRAFQANTKIITTADELLDELNRI